VTKKKYNFGLNHCNYYECKCDDRRVVRKYFTSSSDNQKLNFVGIIREKVKKLNNISSNLIKKKVWPFCEYEHKVAVKELIAEIQKFLTDLSAKSENVELCLNIISEFSFSLFIRIDAIDKIRMKKSWKTSDIENFKIMKANDYNMYLKLLKLTHPKNLNKKFDIQVKYLEILKKNAPKISILRISNIVNRAIQLQFVGLLDSIVDSNLSSYMYSFRRGRSPLQAIAFLHKSITLLDIEQYWLLSVNIHQCFNRLSHSYILKNFPFPIKYKCLLR